MSLLLRHLVLLDSYRQASKATMDDPSFFCEIKPIIKPVRTHTKVTAMYLKGSAIRRVNTMKIVYMNPPVRGLSHEAIAR